MNEDGRMARLHDLFKFSKKHNIKLASIEDLISYRLKYEKLISRSSHKIIKLNKNNYVYHAGTKSKNEKIYAIGGRVLNFVSLSDTFAAARKEVHKNILNLNWNGGFYRRDIGYKVIE